MYTICIESSTSRPSVTLIKKKQIVCSITGETFSQVETLVSIIDSVLCKEEISISNLLNIFCCNGPGSFIGIRIGVSAANAMKLINPNIKLFGITSNLLLASQAVERDVITLVHAGKDRCYSQKFTNKNIVDEIKNIFVKDVDLDSNMIVDSRLAKQINNKPVGNINSQMMAEYYINNDFDEHTNILKPVYGGQVNAVPAKKVFDL